MTRVLLGCDMGEASDAHGIENEARLMQTVDAVSIACGGHAGNTSSMQRTVSLAMRNNCLIGAHPSYPDRAGFGRHTMDMDLATLASSITEQMITLRTQAEKLGGTIHFVKAHGALYHRVAYESDTARWFCERCSEVLECSTLVLPIGAPVINTVQEAGVRVMTEGFCDRAYAPDGTLIPRDTPNALITDPQQANAQALRLVREHRCEMLCVHSDSAVALQIAQSVRAGLDGR